jgi:hypothetical protein
MRPAVAALFFACAIGCTPSAADSALLSELSRDELLSLCDELRDETPGPDTPVQCDDGWSATIQTPSNEACRDLTLDLGECEATAGDVRACAEATRRDACSALDATPPECASLHASPCLPWITASAVTAECLPPEAQALSAVEGVYETVSHTQRSGSCEAGGESVLELDADRFVVVVATADAAGRPMGLVQSCSTLEACREAAEPLRESAMQTVQYLGAPQPEFDLGLRCLQPEPAAFMEALIRAPASENDCRLGTIETIVTLAEDRALQLHTQTWEWDQPSEPNGCFFTGGARRSPRADCTSTEMRVLRFLAAL